MLSCRSEIEDAGESTEEKVLRQKRDVPSPAKIWGREFNDLGVGDGCPGGLGGGLAGAVAAAEESSGCGGGGVPSLQCGAAHPQEGWLLMLSRPVCVGAVSRGVPFEWHPFTVTCLINSLMQLINSLMQLINSLMQLINSLMQLINSLMQLINSLMQLINSLMQLINSLMQLINSLMQLINSLMQLINSLMQLINSLMQLINSLMQLINSLMQLIHFRQPVTPRTPSQSSCRRGETGAGTWRQYCNPT
ncbi:hypothetical protein GWK47_021579 [Chionoecetes opilio]|uniref:Uncharacterized protein n=1 Tax=Chionoecetes opilio TaxID=41210 RepID=A0A8J4XRK1_CHIOP|nr:hypothetical protein GWK47_021579 [Chionoecetes opilio]